MTGGATDPEQHWRFAVPTTGVRVEIKTEESAADAEHRRRKDFLLFVAALTFVAVLALVAAVVAFGGFADPKQREWGMGVLLLIVGGCIGFLTGKNVR